MKTLIAIIFVSALALEAQPNPTAAATNAARRANFCSDPWVTLAIRSAYGRDPRGKGQEGECAVGLYRNGSWQNYAQLQSAVASTLSNLSSQGVQFSLIDNRNGTLTISTAIQGISARTVVGGRIVIDQGANIITQDGAGIVSHDGGTLISNNPRQLLSANQRKAALPGGSMLVVTGR